VTGALDARASTIRRLTAERFDVLVVGGGIVGAGVARDASQRGLRTALLEQDDFASGTSSRSSRLIHGGVRYLEHGHLHLVFESSRERRTLLRIAPHLVRPLAFTWPVYRGARVSRAALSAGLTLYDLLALFRNVAPHRRLDAAGVAAAEPALERRDLLGGARYHDASTDDCRLTLANAVAARESGAAVLNHAAVRGFTTADGRATGVTAADAFTGATFPVGARTIVNATGPWTDSLQRLEHAAAASSILGSKGAHVAVPRSRVGNRDGVAVVHPADGRVMFALPAGEQTILGTTESPTASPPSDVRASREDVAYLLAAGNAYFPAASLGEPDVVAAWAGIRPLAAGLAGADAGAASREHAISTGALGVLNVTGGKLTTYRVVAEQVVDQVADLAGRPHLRRCRTSLVPLPGGDFGDPDGHRRQLEERVPGAADRARLHRSYGTRWPAVWSYVERSPPLGDPIAPDAPRTGAELVYAVEHELALTLGDLLIRRTGLAFERPDHAIDVAAAAGRIVAPYLGWSAQRLRQELDAYEEEVERTFTLSDEDSNAG
jgi:glycerol-3-phosphate dehydrogenase